MIKIGNKVKCIKYISHDVKMDKEYTVIGVQLSFDGKEFLHLKEVTPSISYDAKHFIKGEK